MSRRTLLGSTTLAERFPGVMRLLGAPSADDQRDPGDEDPTDPPADDPPADDPPADDPPADDPPADDPPADDPPADEPGARRGPTNNAALLAAFESDANRLVAAERDRCIAVFTSDAGRANPDGAAACLAEGLTSERSIALLGTVSGRSLARNRLNGDPATRVRTGAGREGRDEQAQDERAAHKARRDKRNQQAKAKGGKKPLDATSDD